MSTPTLKQFLSYMISGDSTGMTAIIIAINPAQYYTDVTESLTELQTNLNNSAYSSMESDELYFLNQIRSLYYGLTVDIPNWNS